ncbi:hypothetical protein [Ohtaekwangia sp.]|uniref:hypothetical protein n=1 Tax=Ohtaekwangia sp. TaxID=2066019 RepID=UPI002F93021F
METTICRKLSDTFDKYRDILPLIYDIEQVYNVLESDSYIAAVDNILTVLQEYRSQSSLAEEMFGNIIKDFWHGINEKNPGHKGKYYIDSVVDND